MIFACGAINTAPKGTGTGSTHKDGLDISMTFAFGVRGLLLLMGTFVGASKDTA